MPIDSTILPQEPEKLARILETHAARENDRAAIWRMMDWLGYWYLRGYRRFDRLDPIGGSVVPFFLEEDGSLQFQSQELVARLDQVVGMMNSLDLRPSIQRTGIALAGLRERASGQVIADAINSPSALSEVGRDANFTCAFHGTVGVHTTIANHGTIGLTADHEVVHPRELLPFPTLGMDRSKMRGLMRQRVVQWDRLKDIFGDDVKKNERKMDVWEQSPSESLEDNVDAPAFGSTFSWGLTGPGRRAMPGVVGVPDTAGGGAGGYDENIRIVRVRELWLRGVRGTVSRYIVASRDAILVDTDLEATETYCPLNVSRFIDIGDFRGMGIFHLLFGVCRELERLLKSLWDNVRTMDRYGILAVPQGMVNDRAAYRDIGHGLRCLPFQQDAMFNEDTKPLLIQPANAGTLPGQVAVTAREALESISPVQDLAADKGRIDSAAGLQYLDEQMRKPMANPIGNIAAMWGDVHRASLQQASREVAVTNRAIPVSRLSLELAGVLIDMKKGTASFPENPIPVLSQLNCTIESLAPRSPSTMKMELLEWLKAGVTDPQGARLYLLKQGVDAAFWMDDDVAAYESCVIDLLTLYADGRSPGRIVAAPYMAKPDIQLRLVGAFLSGIAVKYASPAVVNAIKAYREFLLMSSGLAQAESVPSYEDEALFAPPQAPAGLPPGGSQPPAPGPTNDQFALA